MELKEIRIMLQEYHNVRELLPADQQLVLDARKASESAYAPYSLFKVGAAVKLANGVVVKGNNQENAAYPSGLCAERTALFYANANYPDVAVEAIAVSAQNSNGFLPDACKPCGSCRQALLEAETRFGSKMKIILDGQESIIVLDGVESLLPLSFKPDSLG